MRISDWSSDVCSSDLGLCSCLDRAGWRSADACGQQYAGSIPMGADGAFRPQSCAVAGYDCRMAGCRGGFPLNLWRVCWRKEPGETDTHAALAQIGSGWCGEWDGCYVENDGVSR